VANIEKFQAEVDKFFMSSASKGWDESRIRRKVEDELRKFRYVDPTLYRRALYTITKILNIDIVEKPTKQRDANA